MLSRIIEPTQSVEVIADSLSPRGHRLTTFIINFERWILAEINTHRMLSKNVASSRAIPFEKMCDNILKNTAVPLFFGSNQKGMQSTVELSADIQEQLKAEWYSARDSALRHARNLHNLGLHKQHVNRICENFSFCRAIVSGTDFENFFALRAHPDAQPEFQALAYKMLKEYNKSTPTQLKTGEWHIPFGDRVDEDRLGKYLQNHSHRTAREFSETPRSILDSYKRMIAIARCARVSYFNFDGTDDYSKDIAVCERLFGSIPRHLSPTEHVAQAVDNSEFVGNFRGFKQFRKFFQDENLKEPRVSKY